MGERDIKKTPVSELSDEQFLALHREYMIEVMEKNGEFKPCFALDTPRGWGLVMTPQLGDRALKNDVYKALSQEMRRLDTRRYASMMEAWALADNAEGIMPSQSERRYEILSCVVVSSTHVLAWHGTIDRDDEGAFKGVVDERHNKDDSLEGQALSLLRG